MIPEPVSPPLAATIQYTDESSLVERLEQVEVSVVAGSDRNIKITRPTDMELARLFYSLEVAELPDQFLYFDHSRPLCAARRWRRVRRQRV